MEHPTAQHPTAQHPTALQLSARIRSRETSVAEVIDDALERAHADAYGAFVHVADEYARVRARELDARLREAGFVPGPLFGVPCPIKDLGGVAGMPLEAGATVLRGNVASLDDGVVTLLAEAGTVAIGKTATPEFGLPCYTEPEGRPPAATPWDPTRGAGGSSGGAAAAVAGGAVPIAHGSDGGGSIRIPASVCGLVGLKPSRGRVSKGPHLFDGPGISTDGVLTRDVRDTAAALDVLSRRWPGDTYVAPAERFLDAVERPTGRLRVGVLTTPVIAPGAPVHAGAVRAVDRTVGMLEALGHDIAEAPVPFGDEDWGAFEAIWAVGALGAPVPRGRENELRPLTRWLREKGRTVTGEAYAAAVAAQQRVTRLVAERWDAYDVILTPTLAQPPAPHGSLRNDADPAADFAAQTAFTPWTSIWNITGRPSISLPLHVDAVDGVPLPFGIMLSGDLFAEGMLLSLGADLEEAR